MPVFAINGKSILFIHVPKTGGTTIEKVLSGFGPMALHGNGGRAGYLFGGGWLSKPIPLQHLHGALLRRLLHPSQFDVVFMVVRDPVQRMISEYRHARELRRPEALLPFSAWLRISLALTRIDGNFRNNHFRAQAEFLVDGAQVHHYEDGLLPCLNAIAASAGIPALGVLPQQRQSKSFAAEPSQRDMALIQSAFASDYAMFPRYRTGGA